MSTDITGRAPARSTTIHPGQWRLDRIEVVNWGTFHHHHRIEVARKGFLLTGHSGSGKSSLVDAVTAVLTPRGKIHFNAAAADSATRSQDRNIASYVRGAWRRQTDETTGEVVSEHLRPGATWSGILLRYSADTDVPPITLVKLFHMRRGASTPADTSELHVLLQEPVGLLDFQEFARDGLETRRIQLRWPEAMVKREHAPFATRFCRLLGIAGDNALQLLHKTQSAKNLGNLDDLFRGFMLDAPGTFALADNAVAQFSELSEAHAHVVEARKQIDHLTTLRPHVAAYDEQRAAEKHASALRESLDPFKDGWKLELARIEQEAAIQKVRSAENALREATALVEEATNAHTTAILLVERHGGEALSRQRSDVEQTAVSLRAVTRERADFASDLHEVGIKVPTSFEEYEELRTTARKERAELEDARTETKAEVLAVHETRAAAVTRKDAVEAELKVLKRSKSNLDSRLLRARELVCERTGLTPTTVPFAGELIQVRPEFQEWTGAIERVLRPLATVMLVPAAHREAVARAVDAVHLGTRLVFEVVPVRVDPARPVPGPRSLVRRVDVQAGPMKDWLDATLSRTYDYECVEHVQELHALQRAVTLAGQVKRSATRYEKDDRSRTDDRRHWVLGFDNADKVDDLLDELRALTQEIAEADAKLGRFERDRDHTIKRAGVLKVLDRRQWSEVDVTAAEEAHTRAQCALDTFLAASTDLRAAEHEMNRATEKVEAAKMSEQAAHGVRATAQTALDALVLVITELERADLPDVPVAHQVELEQRYHEQQRSITHTAIDRVTLQVARALEHEREAAARAAHKAESRIVEMQSAFLAAWKALAGDLTSQVEDRVGFVAILDRLTSDRLPDFEEKFFDLLESQSRRNIGQLANEIRRAPGEIREKIVPVNESLRRSPFDEGRFLQIDVKENRSPAVQEFLADLKEISAGSWAAQTRADAETRFAVMDRVMKRLGSSDSGDRNWQALCLDTRRHVKFTGIEVDNDNVQVNIHDSSAGLSGGQRQKLVIFCLAAALRYQLTPALGDTPTYGTVILDEAFDKADSAFTTMAMDVFLEFGFHMILATPLKLLQTLEEYVGGIGLATCRDFRDSSVGLVSIDSGELAVAMAEDESVGAPA